MNKFLGYISITAIVLILFLPLSGCTGSSSTQATAQPSATAVQPTKPATVSVEPSGPAVSAKEWYALAESAAKNESPDVFLYQIAGNNYVETGNLPIDGKLHMWVYSFMSSSTGMTYFITVKDGAVTYTDKSTPAFAKDQVKSWSVDSTAAAATAVAYYKQTTSADPSGLCVQYTLSVIPNAAAGTYTDEWWVLFPDNGSIAGANVKVDANTGSIVN